MSTKAHRLSERIAIDPDAPPPAAAPLAIPAPEPQSTTEPVADEEPNPKKPGEWASCLDDPAILEGRANYRSFYIEDTVFARYRAAVYWCARLADALDLVGENMSVDIQQHMAEVARALEEQFNDGAPFRPTPEQVKKPRRRRRADPAVSGASTDAQMPGQRGVVDRASDVTVV
jgi:hypothetical protein